MSGILIAGRSGPVDGIGSMIGPTIATIPVRVQVDLGAGVMAALAGVEDKVVRSMGHDHLGLQNLARLKGGHLLQRLALSKHWSSWSPSKLTSSTQTRSA